MSVLLRDQYWANTMNRSLRKQPIFRGSTTHFPANGVRETSAEIPYWWRITTQIWVELLICRAQWKIASANQKHKGTKPTTAKLIELGEREIVSGKQAISFLRLTRGYFHYFWVVIFCSIFSTWQVAANCRHAKSNNTEYYRHCAGRQQFITISKWWCLSPKVF